DFLAFQEWQTQIRNRFFAISSPVNPRTDLKNAIADYLGVLAFKSPTYLMSTKQYKGKQNVILDKAMECYQSIFGNASDFTFVVKGKYKEEQVLPLLQKYLGNLPANKKTSCISINSTDENNFKLPNGPLYHAFYANKMN